MKYSNDSSGSSPTLEAVDDNPKSNIGYWKAWIKGAKTNPKLERHRKEARAAWDEYEKEDQSQNHNQDASSRESAIERSYPIYWASTKTLEPAYYARQPKPKAKRRFGVNDVPSLTASIIAERLAEHLIENCHFDEVMVKAVGDFIHGDKATVQVLYEATEVKGEAQRVDLAMTQSEDGAQLFLDQTGAPWQGAVLQDDIGYFAEVSGGQSLDNQKIYLAPAIFDEILHTPDAKCESEITEKAFYFCLTKKKAQQRFAPEVTAKINWKKGKAGDSDSEGDYRKSSSANDIPAEYIEGWECWCKDTKKVYFVSPECYPEGILDAKEDPYHLKNFFPATPFIIGSPPSKHMYPTPPHEHLRRTIEQLHLAYNKVFSLIDGVRRRCLVDGSCPELLRAFSDLEDQEFITVENLSSLIDKGGIQNMIWYLPVQELVQSITELTQIDAQFRNNFNEWFGVPDVLRGVVDPLVTASADKLASGAAHDRFRYQKALVQKMAKDAVQMMLDLALKVYPDEKIARLVGYQYLQPEQQQSFPQALAILRDDEEMLVRMDIETDSTSFVNEQQENQDRNLLLQNVIGGLKEVAGMLKAESPQYAAIALHAVMHSLEGMKGGEDFSEEIKGATNALIQQAMQTPPAAPPPPDVELMKVQLAQQELQMDNANKQRELSGKEFKLQLDQQKQLYEQQLAAAELQLNQRMQAAYEMLETQKLEIERISQAQAAYDSQQTQNDKLLDNVRLEKEQTIEAVRALTEGMQKPKEASPPVFNITVGGEKKKAMIIRTPLGLEGTVEPIIEGV